MIAQSNSRQPRPGWEIVPDAPAATIPARPSVATAEQHTSAAEILKQKVRVNSILDRPGPWCEADFERLFTKYIGTIPYVIDQLPLQALASVSAGFAQILRDIRDHRAEYIECFFSKRSERRALAQLATPAADEMFCTWITDRVRDVKGTVAVQAFSADLKTKNVDPQLLEDLTRGLALVNHPGFNDVLRGFYHWTDVPKCAARITAAFLTLGVSQIAVIAARTFGYHLFARPTPLNTMSVFLTRSLEASKDLAPRERENAFDSVAQWKMQHHVLRHANTAIVIGSYLALLSDSIANLCNAPAAQEPFAFMAAVCAGAGVLTKFQAKYNGIETLHPAAQNAIVGLPERVRHYLL